jgi:hypothetical protein
MTKDVVLRSVPVRFGIEQPSTWKIKGPLLRYFVVPEYSPFPLRTTTYTRVRLIGRSPIRSAADFPVAADHGKIAQILYPIARFGINAFNSPIDFQGLAR